MRDGVTDEMIIDAVHDRLSEAIAQEQFGVTGAIRDAAIECYRLVDSFKNPVKVTNQSTLQEWIEGK